MKKFVVNCDFGGQLAPQTIFIGTPEAQHHPLHFQNDWLTKERNGQIPPDFMESITKLKNLADKNGVRLEDVCVYALGSAMQQSAEDSNEDSEDEYDQDDEDDEL